MNLHCRDSLRDTMSTIESMQLMHRSYCEVKHPPAKHSPAGPHTRHRSKTIQHAHLHAMNEIHRGIVVSMLCASTTQESSDKHSWPHHLLKVYTLFNIHTPCITPQCLNINRIGNGQPCWSMTCQLESRPRTLVSPGPAIFKLHTTPSCGLLKDMMSRHRSLQPETHASAFTHKIQSRALGVWLRWPWHCTII